MRERQPRPTTRIWLAAAIALAAPVARAQDSAGVVHGTVQSREHHEPLSYATVTLDSTAAVVFADSSGTFRIAHVKPGRHRVRARELGYAPTDTIVDIGPSQSIELTLALARIPNVLPPVFVRGKLRCRTPGISDSTMSPEVVTLAEELLVNAERAHLLARTQPFDYWIEATLSAHREYRPDLDRDEVDTLIFRSDDRHNYRKGDMIDSRFYGRMVNQRYGENADFIYLPELEDLAIPGFVSHHCFTFGGIDSSVSQPELRIDFRPLDRMHDTDAEGSFFLDPTSFVARRAVIHLTNGYHQIPPIRRLEAFIWYREIAPLIVVEDSARYNLVGGSALTGGEVTQVELQHVIKYHFRPAPNAK
jgi:hypothetical protein